MTADTDIIKSIFGEPAPYVPATSSEEEAAVEAELAVERILNTAERPGNTLSYVEKQSILRAIEEKERRARQMGHLSLFPEEGPYSYDKYPKHMEFMRLGATHRERLFMAGNRVGKSITGAFELVSHCTGQYPKWWEGKRFPMNVDTWAAGDTGQTTRDIIQKVLLGDNGSWGTGLIPADCLGEIRMRPGIPGAVDTVKVKHTSGRWSTIGFKSYDQKRRAFQGTNKDVIWLDEEPPLDVYVECLIRTMTTGGIVMVTATPLQGLTEFIQEYMNAANAVPDSDAD